jgi:serine/threonine-protein kinase
LQLINGVRLGPYEILSPIGAGGMGEVYRARDTRLGRDVAIKILPNAMSDDPKLRARFEREAKAISALNHPNICALYDIGEVAGGEGRPSLQYIVMEYLEGETLEQRLKKGPLPLDQVLHYAIQIADALDKANRKQILHRDLKPSNIMITKAGARLFDFGLAKSLRGLSQHGYTGQLPDLSSRFFDASTPAKSITAEGSVIGTLEYMAPEQLQGRDADARTDIFAFGVCLYQMITGRRPFQGNSRDALIAAILDQDPAPASRYQPSCLRSLDWLVKECLAKDPDDRIQTAHDAMLELQRIAEEAREKGEKTPVLSVPARKSLYPIFIGVAVLACVTAVLIVRHVTGNRESKGIRRFSISLPATAGLAPGNFEKFAVSRDGTRIAYVSGETTTRLFLYSVDSLETRPLPETEGARGPFFSPDGQWIGFYTPDGGLKKIAVARGSPISLNTERDIRGATWGGDDTIIFAESVSLLLRISGSGNRVETVATYDPKTSVRWPSFLPDDEHVLYTVNDSGSDYERAALVVRSLKTGAPKTLLKGATYGRYVAPGFLAFLRSQTLFAVPFNLRKMEVTGSSIPLASDIDSYFASGLAYFAVSGDGSIFYLPRDSSQSARELVWVDRSGSATALSRDRRAYEDPKLSPDGKRLLVAIGPRPRLDLWSYDIAGGTWSRLTTEATNITGIWSPDGKQIAFSSNRNGGFDLYIMPSDGSGPATQITARRGWDFPRSWSPDGKVLTVFEQYRATLRDIFIVSPLRGSVPTPLVATPANEDQAVFSPDGRWIAYQSNQSGRDEIYVQSYPPTGQKWMISTNGGTKPVWRRDGTELFYRNGRSFMSVTTRIGSDFWASRPQVLFKGDFDEDFDVTPDGQRFTMVKRPPQAPRTQINVVLGAFDHLK